MVDKKNPGTRNARKGLYEEVNTKGNPTGKEARHKGGDNPLPPTSKKGYDWKKK